MMDKAVIFGVYEFVGFYLCKELLEQGYEVKGILFNPSTDAYIEEKRLEIGRNANFTEKIIGEWEELEHEDESPSLIIISIYDLFMGYKEKLLNSEAMNKRFFQQIDNRKGNQNQIVCLLPIQLLVQSIHSDGINDLRFFLEKLKGMGKGVQYYYLPSIFGPWQPATFFFQKSMLNILKENVEQTDIREWSMDAVFIEDAINTIIKNMKSGNVGHFVLESGLTNQWKECADWLNIDPQFRYLAEREDLILDDHMVRLPVINLTPISDSLTKQREHLKNYSCF